MDFLNSRATLLLLLALIAVAAFMYYSRPEHQATGMGRAIQKLSYGFQKTNQSPRTQTPDMGYKLIPMSD